MVQTRSTRSFAQHQIPGDDGCLDFDVEDLEIFATPPLGAYWHGEGGIYAGYFRLCDCKSCFHLVFNVGSFPILYASWDYEGVSSKQANHFSDGMRNTLAMARAGNKLARDILSTTINGHNDWYLPSQAEAHLLGANAFGLIPGGIYWTSTQVNESRIWCQDMASGAQTSLPSSAIAGIILVRRFTQ